MDKYNEYSFSTWWKQLPSDERDRVAIDLSKACNVSLVAVWSWGQGYRTARVRLQPVIAEYLRSKGVNCQTLFPK